MIITGALCTLIALPCWAQTSIAGHWSTRRDNLRSPITLDITDNVFSAAVGCYRFSTDYTVTGKALKFSGLQYETDGPCDPKDRADPAVQDRSRKTLKVIEGAAAYEKKRGVLTLSAKGGQRITFK